MDLKINTENLRLGDTTFAVGAPLGDTYSGTVTKGILSGKDRLVEVSSLNTTLAASPPDTTWLFVIT